MSTMSVVWWSTRFRGGGERGLVAPLVFKTSATGTPRRVGSIPAASAMVLVLVVFPLALVVAAFIAARQSVRNSRLRITSAGIEIDNHRQDPRVVAIADAQRFEPKATTGAFSGVQPRTAVLVLRDGTRLTVRSIHDTESGAFGIDALNDRLAQLR